MNSSNDPYLKRCNKRYNSTLRSMSKKKMAGVFTTDQLTKEVRKYYAMRCYTITELTIEASGFDVACRRIDLFCWNTSTQKGYAVEVKVSRNDFFQDIQANKQQAARDSNLIVVWAVPKSQLSLEEVQDAVPASDKVIVFSRDKWGGVSYDRSRNWRANGAPVMTDANYAMLWRGLLAAAAAGRVAYPSQS